jgi:hypothetical protein
VERAKACPLYPTLEITMKIHGYSDNGLEIEEIVPTELAEITLIATPEELRRIAIFLENCANRMEIRGKSWDHEHLSDKDNYFKDSPHFVVFNPDCDQ